MTEYFLCFDPTPSHTFKELRDWRKELLGMDQDDFGVQVALKEVDAVIKGKTHPPLLICFDPTPCHSFRELRDFRKELLGMDQSHPDVIDALADVNECIREKETDNATA